MILSTVYEIGQEVWNLWDRTEHETVPCRLCAGAGSVPVVGLGDLIKCPKCYGKGETETGEAFRRFYVSSSSLTVGLVRITIEGPVDERSSRYQGYAVDQSNMGPRSHKRVEEYMCAQTGVGSGSIYKVENLFPSQEEAEAEARIRTLAAVAAIERYDEVTS